jgi:8-oxo-dGTP pyrophosphatase MutT (NUDIX family)
LLRHTGRKVLLLQIDPARLKDHSRSYWKLPGGRIQRGESLTGALGREVADETGLAIEEPVLPGKTLARIRIPVAEQAPHPDTLIELIAAKPFTTRHHPPRDHSSFTI